MSLSSVDVNLLSPEAIRDPAGYFGTLRETHPVLWNDRYRSWILTSHRHVNAALRDERFASERITPFIQAKLTTPDTDPAVRQAFEVLADWLVFKDPPAHTRLRGLVSKAFTPRTIAAMQTRIDKLCDELLGGIPRQRDVDLVGEFALPLTSIVIAEMLGVPVDDRPKFRIWTDDISPIASAGLDDPERYARAATAMAELTAYFGELIGRYEQDPQDNLLTALIDARDAGRALSQAEVVATCTLLLFAGHETTANLIANAVVALADHPAEEAALRDGRVPIRSAVEEFLRYDGPAKAIVRILDEDVELEDQTLRAGQRAFLILASANRDPRVFEEPEVLRLDRVDNPHLTFGFGIHFCLGAALARMETAVAIPKILRRFPDLTIDRSTLRWQPVLLARVLHELPVRVGAGAPGR